MTAARRIVPGFGLSLGIALAYLGAIVVLPLAALAWQAARLRPAALWATLGSERTLAAFALSVGAAVAAAAVSTACGVAVAWVLVRYRFWGRALVDAVLGAVGVPWDAVQTTRPFLHPGRAGEVRTGDAVLGIFGELHPTVAAAWGFEEPVAVFAIDLGKTAAAAPGVATYEDVTTFPEVRQDLAVIVPDDVAAARVLDVVRDAGGALVRGAEVFDVYRGGQVGEGRVSLALHLHFRAADRTLTDEDVAPVRERIVARLAADLDAELRGA